MAVVFQEYFENGSSGNNLTTGNTVYETVAGNLGGTAVFDSAQKANGNLSARIQATTAGTFTLGKTLGTAKTLLWTQFNFMYRSLPSANLNLLYTVTGASTVGELKLNTDGKLWVRDQFTKIFETPSALSSNTWYRISFKCQPGVASTGHELKVYALGGSTPISSQAGNATAAAASSVSGISMGALTQSTHDHNFDDVIFDDATEPVPSGDTGIWTVKKFAKFG